MREAAAADIGLGLGAALPLLFFVHCASSRTLLYAFRAL